MTHRRHGRREPYTETGVRRLPCFRCGDPAEYQWQICSDSNLYRPLCAVCDVALNALVLAFVRHPDGAALIQQYADRKRVAA